MAIDDKYRPKSPLQTALPPANGTVTIGGAGGSSPYSNPMYDQMKQLGPQMAKAAMAYPGALQAASDAEMKAYNDEIGLTQGALSQLQQPGKNDMWGRLGAAMLSPTKTGSFFEAYGNAANAAMDARSDYRDKESQRQEKLLRTQMALAEIQARKPNADIARIENQSKAYQMFNDVGGMQADIDSRSGVMPKTDEDLIADYNANPMKYSGEQGRAIIASAYERLQKQGDRQFELQKIDEQGKNSLAVEQLKQQNKQGTLSPQEEKMVSQAQTNVLNAQSGLENLKEADRLDKSGNVMHGYFPVAASKMGDYIADNLGEGWVSDNLFGSKEQREATQRYYQFMRPESLEKVKQSLPGPMSNNDVKVAFDTYADQNATEKAREDARNTIISAYKATDRVGRDQLIRLLGPEGAQQLLGDAETSNRNVIPKETATLLKQAIEHASSNDAWGGVAAELKKRGINITADELRQLTPEQIDEMAGGN